MQLAGLAVTLGLAVTGGLITGGILKIPFFEETRIQSLFDDKDYWQVKDVRGICKMPNCPYRKRNLF